MSGMPELLAEFSRALCDKVLWQVVTATLLGLLQQSLWLIVPLGLLLTLFSVVSDEHWYDQFKARDLLSALWGFWLLCLGQNLLFVGAAFVAGQATRWLWF